MNYICRKINLLTTYKYIKMRKSNIISTFLIFLSPIELPAQFHTIRHKESFYRIQADTLSALGQADYPAISLQISTENNPQTVAETSNPAPTLSSSSDGTAIDSIRSAYIANYLSASFPLRQVIVTSPFGTRTDPFSRKPRLHNGLDLRASDKDEAYAMLPGTVIRTGKDKRAGLYVTLLHGDISVSYCHLSRICVQKGNRVHPGDIIGITGKTGRATGPHLHLTCRVKGKYIDPSLLIDFVQRTKIESIRMLSSLPYTP